MVETAERTPTQDLWHHYEEVYDYLNEELFEASLPKCVLNFATHGSSNGYFTPGRWVETRKGREQHEHEISLNPYLLDGTMQDWLPWLTRLMVQLWVYGQEGAGQSQGYYSKTFTDKMWAIGLPATDDGTPSGKRTGFTMRHWIEPTGRLHAVMKLTPPEYFPWRGDKRRPQKTKNKPLKYGCSNCGIQFTITRPITAICMTENCKTAFEPLGS